MGFYKTTNHQLITPAAHFYKTKRILCVQPLGQIIYGFFFDKFNNAVSLVLIPTGVIVCLVGLLARNFFRNLETEQITYE